MFKGSGKSRYSFLRARKCDELEAATLMARASGEGRTEWGKRLAASKYRHKQQRSVGDGDGEGGTTQGNTQAVLPASAQT